MWPRCLPVRTPRLHRCPGRLPADDRATSGGIVHVLCKSVSWRDVPAEPIGCSGVTAWHRLRDWTEAGVCPQLHEALLAEPQDARLLDMNDVEVGRLSCPGPQRGLTPDFR
ncbi:transposase [Streptomyces sp. NPDC002540]